MGGAPQKHKLIDQINSVQTIGTNVFNKVQAKICTYNGAYVFSGYLCLFLL